MFYYWKVLEKVCPHQIGKVEFQEFEKKNTNYFLFITLVCFSQISCLYYHVDVLRYFIHLLTLNDIV